MIGNQSDGLQKIGEQMTGKRLKPYRSGDWNEELGVLLLKAFAAVAPVQQHEDFGIDAVATLLRHDKENRLLYAEESFYVQLKSESSKSIEYNDEEIQWLRNLQLPFFVGVVRKKESSLRLYAGHNLNRVFIGPKDFKQIKVGFGDERPLYQKIGQNGVKVNLGAPLLEFNIRQAAESDFVDLAYDILKPYLVAEQRNVNHRRVRFCREIAWKTNEKPTLNEGCSVGLGKPVEDEFRSIVESLLSGFHALAIHADVTKNRDEFQALVALTRELEKAGFEFGSLDSFEDELTEWKPPKPLLYDD